MNYRLWLLIIISISVFGIGDCQTLKDSVQIHFRQSKTDIDSSYMHNDKSFKRIEESALFGSHPDSLLRLQGIQIVGGASPEGSVRFNKWLSEQRARRISDYLKNRMVLPDSLAEVQLLGRDWEGLRRMVLADANVPQRQDVLVLLDEIIKQYHRGERESDGNLARLKKIGDGVPYRYMYHKLFPSLRESEVILTYAVNMPPLAGLGIHSMPQWPDESSIYMPTPLPSTEHNFYMALKSNLICDALSLPEIGAEFYLGKNFSIVGNWMYGWWDKDSAHRYWRAYGGDLAVRWWFGQKAHEKPLTGHHIGVYGGVVTYDFEFGGKGYMGGRPGHSLWDRCMHHAGIEYGYSLPIARRWNIDFTVGLGYLGGKYVEYVPKGRCYEWEATKYRHWYGPTKLEVSLTWLIGHGNYNKKGAHK